MKPLISFLLLLLACPLFGQERFDKSSTNEISPHLFVTVSSRGIRNGLASRKNDGCMFGPDTVGTSTCGLQEALNALPATTEYGPTATGINLQLTSGYFYFTNALLFSNLYTSALKIEGNTLLDSKLIYMGTNTGISTITIRGGINTNANSLSIPMHVVMRDIGFAALNTTNILLSISNYSYLEIDSCNFTSWEIMTNQVWGSGVSIGGLGPTFNTPGLVGAVLGSGVDSGGSGDNFEHATIVHNNFFAGLATGVHLRCDHAYVDVFKTAFIAQDNALNDGTLWANTSPYSLGASILRTPGMDSYYNHVHFYSCMAGLVVLNVGDTTDYQFIDNFYCEGVSYTLAAQNPGQVKFYCTPGNIITGLGGWSENRVSTSPYAYAGQYLGLYRPLYTSSARLGTVKLTNGIARVLSADVTTASLPYLTCTNGASGSFLRVTNVVAATRFDIMGGTNSGAGALILNTNANDYVQWFIPR